MVQNVEQELFLSAVCNRFTRYFKYSHCYPSQTLQLLDLRPKECATDHTPKQYADPLSPFVRGHRENSAEVQGAFRHIIAYPARPLLTVGKGLVAEGIAVAVNALGAVYGDAAAAVFFHGMNHLALPRDKARNPLPHGNAAGVFNIVAPDEKIPDRQADAAHRLRVKKQGDKGRLLSLDKPVFHRGAVFVKALFELRAVHPALCPVRPKRNTRPTIAA